MSTIPTKMCFNTDRADNRSATLSQIQVEMDRVLQYHYLRLSNYVIPNTFDNIITDYNNKLTITESGEDDNTVSLPQGAYTITSLVSALKALLDASSPNDAVYTITPDPLTCRLTIACTVSIAYKHSLSTLGRVLGFSSTHIASGTSIVGDLCYNVSPNEIYILCNLVRMIKINNAEMRILDKVAIDKNFGYRLTNANIDSEFVNIDGSGGTSVELTLVFADGKRVPMRNGWSCDIDFIATPPE